MLDINLIQIILTILAENGETRTLTFIKLINNYVGNIQIKEPLVFEHIIFKQNKENDNKSKKYMDTDILLPLYNIRVDWGDGEVTQINGHKYENLTKKYRVKIYNSENKDKSVTFMERRWLDNIIDFISLGRIGLTDLRFMFVNNIFRFRIHPNWDTSRITDMSYMFCGARNFNQKFGDNWDTSRVIGMDSMFCGARNFNQKIGDNWVTSRVTNMASMFQNAIKFNQKIGDNWDTSNVTDMYGMFLNAVNFNQKIGDNWNTSRVTSMTSMFCGAIKFNQKIGDNWDTSNVKTMDSMFGSARNFNQKIGHNWDTSQVRDMSYMFYDITNLTQRIGENWDTSQLCYAESMFPDYMNKELLPSWYV